MDLNNEKVNLDEATLVTIAKYDKSKGYSVVKKIMVVAPNRKSMSELGAILPVDEYAILERQTIDSYQDFNEFMKQVIEEAKPKGLSFGIKDKED